MTRNELILHFIASDEFKAKTQWLNNREFVRQYYLSILGREPEQGGWDYWVGRLEEVPIPPPIPEPIPVPPDAEIWGWSDNLPLNLNPGGKMVYRVVIDSSVPGDGWGTKVKWLLPVIAGANNYTRAKFHWITPSGKRYDSIGICFTNEGETSAIIPPDKSQIEWGDHYWVIETIPLEGSITTMQFRIRIDRH